MSPQQGEEQTFRHHAQSANNNISLLQILKMGVFPRDLLALTERKKCLKGEASNCYQEFEKIETKRMLDG